MECNNLAATGSIPSQLLLIGAGILLLGVVVLLLARRRSGVRPIVGLALLLAVGIALVPVSSPGAQAAPTGCAVKAPDTISIVQTSVMEGLSPDTDARPIAGRVTNNSADDTYIDEITVSIVGVTRSAGARPGTCDATDYVIVEPVMDVRKALLGGASVDFSGASIGFVDKATNQDGCQGAIVSLLYSTEG